MLPVPSRTASVRAVGATVAGALLLASLTGCTQIASAFNGLQQNIAVATPAPRPSSSAAVSMPFDSKFTYDGSVSLSTNVADGLEVRLDVWAADPKRTQEWTAGNDKTFGFAVNVVDHRVDEKAVLAQKRRVYLSMISVTSQVSQTTIGQQQMMSPFQFSADPRTLVPTDTLRSDRGLLLNTFQGGLLVPSTTIHQLPGDTYGITLQFALQVWVEGTANTDTSFAQQTVYQVLPIAIFSPTTSTQ